MGKSLTPCLWFDREAEDAAKFYTSVFPNSKIVSTTRTSARLARVTTTWY